VNRDARPNPRRARAADPSRRPLPPPSALPRDPSEPTEPLLATRPPPPDDPWSYRGGPLARDDPRRPEGRRRGPPGCVLGGIALLLIAAVAVVAALLVWPLAARPMVRGVAEERIREAVATEIGRVGPAPVRPGGDLVVSEAELNAYLRDRGDDFGPIGDPAIDIAPGGLRLNFTLYGTDNAVHGRPAVREGRVALEEVEVDGAAARVIGAEAGAALIEEQLAALLATAAVRPMGITLGEGTLTVATEPVG